jgi:hypothetical protein
VIERLGHVLRTAADVLAPPPPLPSPKIALTVTHSRRKLVDGVEWLPDALDEVPLNPPIRRETMGPYDTIDLGSTVNGFTEDGRPSKVTFTYHLRWQEVRS